jgi:hypothetical protein
MTSNRNMIVRSLHDLGAAAWFGGTLMGAVGVNGGSKDVKDAERATIVAAGWARWAPVSAAAIGATLPIPWFNAGHYRGNAAPSGTFISTLSAGFLPSPAGQDL